MGTDIIILVILAFFYTPLMYFVGLYACLLYWKIALPILILAFLLDKSGHLRENSG